METRLRDIDNVQFRLSKGRDKLLDAYQEGETLTLDELKNRLKALDLQNKALLKEKKSLENLGQNEQKAKNMQLCMEEIRWQIENAVNLSIKDKQNVLRLLVDEIVITNNQIDIRHCIPCPDENLSKIGLLCSDGYVIAQVGVASDSETRRPGSL